MFGLARVHHLHLHACPHPHIIWHRPVAGTRIPILHGLWQCRLTAMQRIRRSRRHRLGPLEICDGLGRWSVLSMFVRQVERTSAKRPALLLLQNKHTGMVHSVSGWTRGVQVTLWDPLKTRAITERHRGVFTTRRYTNSRLPLPYTTDLCHVTPSETYAIDNPSPSSSILCCLHPAMPQNRLSTFLDFQVFLGHPLPLWACGAQCEAR